MPKGSASDHKAARASPLRPPRTVVGGTAVSVKGQTSFLESHRRCRPSMATISCWRKPLCSLLFDAIVFPFSRWTLASHSVTCPCTCWTTSCTVSQMAGTLSPWARWHQPCTCSVKTGGCGRNCVSTTLQRSRWVCGAVPLSHRLIPSRSLVLQWSWENMYSISTDLIILLYI